MINSKDTPKLKNGSDFWSVVIHEELEGEEGRNIEGQ